MNNKLYLFAALMFFQFGHSHAALGENLTNLLSIDFETSEGYSAGFPIGMHSPWRANDTNGSGITQAWPGLGQQAFIGMHPLTAPADTLVERYPVSFPPPSGQYPYVSFSVAMAVQPSTKGESDDFVWGFESSDGSVMFDLDFDTSSGLIYYETNDGVYEYSIGTRFTNAGLYRLEIDMDFLHNSWTASISGTPITPSPLPIGGPVDTINQWYLVAAWLYSDTGPPGNNTMYFDHIRLIAGNILPIFPKPVLKISPPNDGRGLSVSVETEPGLPYIVQLSGDLQGWVPFGG